MPTSTTRAAATTVAVRDPADPEAPADHAATSEAEEVVIVDPTSVGRQGLAPRPVRVPVPAQAPQTEAPGPVAAVPRAVAAVIVDPISAGRSPPRTFRKASMPT